MESRARILLTGIPGVGKTSLATHPLIAGNGCKAVTFSSLMLDAGKRLGLISRREDFRTIDQTTRQTLQREAARALDEEPDDLTLVVDGHLLVDTERGIIPGFPLGDIVSLKFLLIVLVVAAPEQVLSRRREIPEKYGMLNNSLFRITLDQQLVLQTSLLYSFYLRVPLQLIENPESMLAGTAGKLKKLVELARSDLDAGNLT